MHLVEFPIRVVATVTRIAHHGALRGALNHAGEFRERHMVTSLFIGHFDERSKTEFFRVVIMVHGGYDRSIPLRSNRLDKNIAVIRLQRDGDRQNL
jgi:hypothetical protein